MLIESVVDVRSRAEPIAEQIAHDLPEFTVHDQTHIDALWPLMELVAPRALTLTPTEAWALAIAVVLHDLGLAVAAYPGGVDELRGLPGWPDARAAALRARLGRPPTRSELDESTSDSDLDFQADAAILRQRHATRAAELVDVEFPDGRLVANDKLREALGATAGRVAASHWWRAERLADLGRLEGAPAGMPAEWTVRPIVLAALLRVADAAHLDALRAPRAERARRRLGKIAARHWDFQGRLRQPVLEGDQVLFTSTEPFGPELAGSWWTCLDHLRLLEAELVGTAAVLQSHGFEPLRARSVVGAQDPRQLARSVRVVGWDPVDAQVEVSDVARLVTRLGGRALYGATPYVPLRELLQNAADAVLARERMRPGYHSHVEVRLCANGRRLVVHDRGVGMNEAVLTGALLDFGRSLWESPQQLASSLPGLQAAGFSATGRFGIGFFSVFMWSDTVDVISRPLTDGEADTRVLSFREGLAGRPLLRPAALDERLSEPGTRVELLLKDPLTLPSGKGGDPKQIATAGDLRALLGWLAPCLPVDLRAGLDDDPLIDVSSADDWTTIPGSALLQRLGVASYLPTDVADRCVVAVGDEETPAGRGSLTDGHTLFIGPQPGVTVAGGLRVGTSGEFCGVLVVEDVDAARTSGCPTASPAAVTAWASRQAQLLVESRAGTQFHARAVLDLGGEVGDLPWARTADGMLNSRDLREWAAQRQSVAVLDVDHEISEAREHAFIPEYTQPNLAADVIDVPSEAIRTVSIGGTRLLNGVTRRTLAGLLRETLAAAWDCPFDDVQVADFESYELVRVVGSDDFEVSATRWSRPTARLPGL